MWYPFALLGAAILLQVVAEDTPHRTKRLTTFGKTPTAETDPKIPRGKECRSDDDCTGLEFTTCKVDSDHKKRCLCYDFKPPANAECATKKRDARGYVLIGNRRPPKELHQNCNYDHECIQGAECVVNSTIKANEKRCYCRFGYEEEDNACNSGYAVSVLFSLVLLTSLALLTTKTL